MLVFEDSGSWEVCKCSLNAATTAFNFFLNLIFIILIAIWVFEEVEPWESVLVLLFY